MKKLFAVFIILAFSSIAYGQPAQPLPKVATQAEAEAGTSTALRSWTPQRIAQAAAAQAGAGATEVVDADFGAGWNNDTTHAPSKDDLYDVINPLLTAVGVAAAATHLGAFSGSTIADNQTVKAALQALETAVEGKEGTLTAASQAEMETGTEVAIRSMSPLRVAQAIAALGSSGTGDVTGVGDCASGACLDGTSDGGTYIRLYDGNSHYTQLAAGDSTGNLTFTLPTAAPAGNNAIVVMATTGAMSTLASTTYQAADTELAQIAALTPNQGEVLYYNGSAWVVLGVGVSGQYLQTQGAGANPQWASTAISGDVEAVGDCTSGGCFNGGSGNSLQFEGATANDFEITLTAVDPGADYTVTIPAGTGTIVLGPADYTADNRLIRTDYAAAKLTHTQITGISVDDSDNLSGAASLGATTFIAVGSDPADAGAIRLENAAAILFEAAPAGTDVNALTVTSGEVVQIGASGASGVTITPLLTASAGVTLATGQNLTVGVVQWNSGDSIDGTKVANADLGDVTVTGGSWAVENDSHNHTSTTIPATTAYTDSASTTWSGAEFIFGDASTDWLTILSTIRGSGRAVTIDNDTTSAPTYATATNELYVEGDIEAGGNIYATGFIVVGGTGDSYVEFVNNAGGHVPGATEYSIYFETDTTNKFKVSISGAEKEVLNDTDAQTISGAKTFSSALTLTRGATGSGQLVIYEDSDDGTNKVTITIPAIAADYTLTLPTTDGDSGQYLQTNGGGTLSWATPSATAHGSDTYVQFNDGGSALGSDAGFTWNKTTNTLTLGTDGQDGSLVLYNELGATDYSTTIVPNASQAAAVTATLPAASGTLATLGNAETFSGTKTFSAAPIPSAATIDIGTAAAEWRNLYLTTGGIIYGEADQSNSLTSSSTGWTTSLDLTVGGADLTLKSDGVKLTGSNGALTILGLGDGADEDVKIDLNTTANQITISSPASSATAVSFSALNLVTTGSIQGGIKISSDADGMTGAEMTTAGVYGTLFIATGAGTWTLPTAVAGMSLCLMDSGTAHDLVLDAPAGDTIRLKGTEGADGATITNATGSTTGDFVCVVAVAANKWSTVGMAGTWTVP